MELEQLRRGLCLCWRQEIGSSSEQVSTISFSSLQSLCTETRFFFLQNECTSCWMDPSGPQSRPEHHQPCSHQLNQFLLYFPFSPAAPEQTLHIYWDVLFSESLNFPAFQWVKSEPFTHTWKGSFHHLCQGILLVGTAPTFLFRSPLGGTPMRVLCHCNDSTPYIEMWLKKIPNKYLFEHI